jgi:hypothetical protein
MTPAAKKFLENLRSEGFQKAAFYAERYKRYNLPVKAAEVVSLPGDKWNSGSNHRVVIQPGAEICLVTDTDTYALGVGGTDTDTLKGLWIKGDYQVGFVDG